MEQPKGHPCPECGAPREPDNGPSCTCARRAADALRDTRTAEAAAAEDFDPLRIRPYVELDGGAPDHDGKPQGGSAPHPHRTPGPQGEDPLQKPPTAPDATMPLRPVPAEAPDDTPDTTSVLPTPLAPPATEPSTTDLSLFEATQPTDTPTAPTAPDPDGTDAPSPRHRRRTALLTIAGACVAVVAAAGYASGLFSYETPSRDTALPDDVRVSVPDVSPSSASAAPATSVPPARPAPAVPSPSASAEESPSPTPSPSASSASPSASKPAEPSPTPTTARPSDSAEASDEASRERNDPELRRGDRGPEVTELQLRLRQLYLYNGDANGNFTPQVEDAVRNYQWSRGIRGDELGVYGQETRAKLEAETEEP